MSLSDKEKQVIDELLYKLRLSNGFRENALTFSIGDILDNSITGKVTEGSAGRMGIATLSSGTVTVSTTAVKTTSRIFCFPQTTFAGFTDSSIGSIAEKINDRIAGSSFKIVSDNNLDTRSFVWIIFEPL